MNVPIRRAFRILLAYEGTTFQLQSAQRIEKITPASVPIEGAEHQAGSWFALEDSKGHMLYRRFLHNLFLGAEVHTDEKRGLQRVAAAQTSGTLNILIPELPDAKTLIICSSYAEVDKAHRTAKRIMAVDMSTIAAMAAKHGGYHGRQ